MTPECWSEQAARCARRLMCAFTDVPARNLRLIWTRNRQTRLIASITIAAASLLAVPAFAATGSANSQSALSLPQTIGQIEQDLMDSLTKAGFTDIHIIPGSFLVHAKDSKGNFTEMTVSPNSITEVTADNEGAQNGSVIRANNGGNGTIQGSGTIPAAARKVPRTPATCINRATRSDVKASLVQGARFCFLLDYNAQ